LPDFLEEGGNFSCKRIAELLEVLQDLVRSPKVKQSEPYLPYVEWNLLGGGTSNNVERFLVLLLITGKGGCWAIGELS
jgi:hypothetical protein